MLQILHQSVKKHEAKKRNGGVIRYVVAHVDTSLDIEGKAEAEKVLRQYQTAYPELQMNIIPLSRILKLRQIDWSSLPDLDEQLSQNPERQLEDMFARLPSATSRTDILRLFVRHILLDEAIKQDYSSLLLGHTTTALAEMTLAEVAKGRGSAIPWLITDGYFPVSTTINGQNKPQSTRATISVCYPMRDVFRKEVLLYIQSAHPLLMKLSPEAHKSDRSRGAVVSYKNISIDEVMTRYFVEVEESYPSIVTNVVRTSTKLTRNTEEDGGNVCGLCGLDLDESSDKRWRGEIGDNHGTMTASSTALCYGCERSALR